MHDEDSNLNAWKHRLYSLLEQYAWLAKVSSDELLLIQTKTSPIRLAAYWYHFSVFAADFLCLALPLLQNPVNRCYVAQTANEELGCGSPEQVHSVLLLEAFAEAGLDQHAIVAYPTIKIDGVLSALKQQLLSAKNDYEIAGFFLGFELLAEHNISHVFGCLQPHAPSGEALRQTPYFQEHFKVEPEHIRRAITLAMNSCTYDYQIKSVLNKFHYTISFWNTFWGVVHEEETYSTFPNYTDFKTSIDEPLLVAQV
ncbi:MAG: iron-containing redox enzyme family protein [Scytonema sp. PMC 1069.18]|nr:iron-containing redox enzyme family protein [Scytonema sp. PMC 1069.18]MEC4879906.1 iron-containing redox enzyme family protein [Scytonema sp. PMC 1070.18]